MDIKTSVLKLAKSPTFYAPNFKLNENPLGAEIKSTIKAIASFCITLTYLAKYFLQQNGNNKSLLVLVFHEKTVNFVSSIHFKNPSNHSGIIFSSLLCIKYSLDKLKSVQIFKGLIHL